MKIEANLLPKREVIENNRVVDWFSTLEETKTAMKRLYNPRLRTPESQEIWDKLPGFLEKNKDLLSFCVGSSEFAVHFFGSMSLGIGTDCKKGKNGEELPISDIDLLIFAGEIDNNKKICRVKLEEAKIFPDWIKKTLEDDKRASQFIEQSNIQNEFNKSADIKIIRVPDVITKIEKICNKFSREEVTTNEWDEFLIKMTALMFGNNSLSQGKQGQEAKWRNELLKVILGNPGGERLWNEGVREYFNWHVFAGYDGNPLLSEAAREKHSKRFEMAFDEILSKRGIKEEHKKSAKEAINKKLATTQLPEFKVIQSLKDKLE